MRLCKCVQLCETVQNCVVNFIVNVFECKALGSCQSKSVIVRLLCRVDVVLEVNLFCHQILLNIWCR